jgi:hypothetical protein
MVQKINIDKVLIKILWIFTFFLIGCNRSIPIAEEDDNPISKMGEYMLDETSKHRGNSFEYHALVGRTYSLHNSYNNKIMLRDTLGWGYWSNNFYKYLYFERLSFTKNDTLIEAFYYVKEKNIMYKCKNQFIKGSNSEFDIQELPFDSSHFGLRFIHTQDTNLLEPNTKYLVTQVKRIGKLKWQVKAQTLWKKD